MKEKLVSIVVPLHNEQSNIRFLIEQLSSVIEQVPYELELILVDDGSTDSTFIEACKYIDHILNISVIKLSRNFGHQAAILCGMRASKGHAVITMDGDLQHPPLVILELIKAWEQGYDVVHTRRLGDDKGLKSTSSRIFYKVLRLTSNLNIEEGMADFRLVARNALNPILSLSESALFFRGLTLWIGYRQTTISYTPNNRYSGESSYSCKKMLELASNGIVSFSSQPLYWILPFGIFVSMISIFYGLYALFIKVFTDTAISGWSSLAVLISFLFGCLFAILGIFGVYLGSINEQIKSRPRYLVSDIEESYSSERFLSKDEKLNSVDF